MSGRRQRRRRGIPRKRISDIASDEGFIKLVSGGDTQISYNDAGAMDTIPSFTWDDTNLKIADDTKLIFGTGDDAFIEYNENGDDFLVISGSSQGIVLSGSTVQIRGTLEGASPLKIAGGIEIVPSANGETTNMKFGDDIKLFFGDN